MSHSCAIGQTLLGATVIWRLARNGDVMWVTLQYACVGDAGELRVMQLANGGCATITHTRA